jgi:hypothetical protein
MLDERNNDLLNFRFNWRRQATPLDVLSGVISKSTTRCKAPRT